MSDEKRKKLASTNSLLPSINYNQIIILVVVLLVTLTSPSSQTPLVSQYECPQACECNESQLSAKCSDIDALISAYSIKHHPTRKNFMPIKILDLSNNQLTKIYNQLELLVNLTELNLSHNRLTQVHKLHFEHLETLDLSHNRITSAKLSKLPKNVIHLDLAHNEITYLPSDFMKLKKLRSLELSENPLNCTCETLMIRNWIQYQHVWTNNVIICASPQVFKGQPWVQARQNDICIESSSTTQASKYNWDDENMLGDDPNAYDNGSEEDVEEATVEDEGEGPSPKAVHSVRASAEVVDNKSEEIEEEEDKSTEKDQDIFDDTASEKSSVTDESETSKSSSFGDDDDLLPISTPPKDPVEPEHTSGASLDYDEASENENNDDDGSGEDSTSVQAPSENDEGSGDDGSGAVTEIIFELSSLGIFNDTSSTEDTLAVGVQKNILDKKEEGVNGLPDSQLGVEKAGQSNENNGTYILLAAIGILLVSLIAFVAVQNRKEKRNKRRNYDVEKEGRNGGTELQDMDKSLLGKPIEKNGNGKHENSPLIGNYEPPAITVNEPLNDSPKKDKSQLSLYENNLPNGNGNAFEPIEPVHANALNGGMPKTPESDEEVFHPANDSLNGPESLNVSPEPPKRYSPIYSPTSPRSARYSPVYSPETGRVKIKLTETPKPKTPVVVTRSRSRAGDGYVNTPNN